MQDTSKIDVTAGGQIIADRSLRANNKAGTCQFGARQLDDGFRGEDRAQMGAGWVYCPGNKGQFQLARLMKRAMSAIESRCAFDDTASVLRSGFALMVQIASHPAGRKAIEKIGFHRDTDVDRPLVR